MRVSVQWLKEFVDFKISPGDMAERLSMLGLEVASIEDLGKKYEKFVVGQVLECRSHPNADRLTVCSVSVGRAVRQIVCGAPNVAAGQKVAVALTGATIPHDQHDPEGKPFRLQSASIRGVESQGMICSAFELDLGTEADGILVLDGSAKPGMALARYLGRTDVVFEIETTANRGDWLCHLGIAREIAALLCKHVKKPATVVKESRDLTRKHVNVRILDAEKCRRYCARVVRGIRMATSPRWMQNRLAAVGIRPINAVVDVTNYVMLETGQPLHAFDFDRIEGHSVVVRCAKKGERFTTLDGEERKLNDEVLMICDTEKSIAIAGVMGGANSQITESSRSVLLESATFEPRNIRRTSKLLGVSTDASQRFERSTDIEMALHAVNRAAQLLQETVGGEVLMGVVDAYPKKHRPKSIDIRVSRANAVLGTRLTAAQVRSHLNRFELAVRPKGRDALSVTIPSFRSDLVEEIDLIEEVARLHGYDAITTQSRGTVYFSTKQEKRSVESELRGYLVGAGFREVVANSMQERSLAALEGQDSVEVINPVSQDMVSLRNSLVPGILQIVAHNINRGTKDLRFFEFGKAYQVRPLRGARSLGDYREEDRLLLCVTGRADPTRWDAQPHYYDIYDLKGDVGTLLSKIFLDKVQFIYYPTTKALTDASLGIEIHKTYAGYLGRITDEIRKVFDVKQEVFVAELVTGVLQGSARMARLYDPVSRFPQVVRDLAFIIDVGQPVQEVVEVIRESGGGLVVDVELFDVFAGERIGRNKKSCAFTVRLVSHERTLADTEVEQIINRIVRSMETRFQAKLRDA